jgi:hypothetical protein
MWINRSLELTFVLGFALSMFAQSDRGTITGTIADPAGAVVANANIEVRNLETGAMYTAGTTTTGNYTVAQLPVGTYELSVNVPGFKRYLRQGLTVLATQTLRIDVALEVGSNTESVTVTAEASLLKTESGEMSHNVSINALDNLPVLGIGDAASASNGSGLRNPYSVLNVLPASNFQPDSSIRLNGLPSNTEDFRIEGQSSNIGLWVVQSWAQPSVDAIQEVAIETSNYAAEYGQAGGGVFNVTMKSGTNQFHGSTYDYLVNTALNAGVPFTNNGDGQLLRPPIHQNDYGFSLGGPVWIPKVYDGHDKTFFFFNFEQFRENQLINNVPITVPTLEMRNGNFSQILTGRSLGTDPFGRNILENTIYNPTTDRVVNGQIERDPFPGNIIPASMMDPVAQKIQSYIPLPNQPGLINNYLTSYSNPRVSSVPSLKMDRYLGSKAKLSGYWSLMSLNTPENDGLPPPITSARGIKVVTNTARINFDYTISPTLLLHLGAGYMNNNYLEDRGNYDPGTTIGLTGTYNPNLFPTIMGLSGAQGGMSATMGPDTHLQVQNLKPTANVSLTWVRDNHTYKFGGEMIVDGYVNTNETYTTPWMVFSPNETGLPALNGVGLPGTVGFGYSSFYLGLVDSGYVAAASRTRLGRHALSGFAQDSWKVTPKFTIDYGLRYDFQTYLKADDGLFPTVSPSTPNPAAGGYPGATIFEGYGPGRCQCEFAHNYPFAFGPRLGIAYQFMPKTVLRLGAGVSYGQTPGNDYQSYDFANSPYSTSSYGYPAYVMGQGVPYSVTFPNFNPGQLPLPGTLASPLGLIDQNAGRPPRIFQWSLGLQREITPDFVVEAAYVGNRGAWWVANYMVNDNELTPQILAAHGLSLNNPTDLKLLGSPINSPMAEAMGFSTPPYVGFPAGASVAQSLRPYPEYTGIQRIWDPIGDTWYNSLQVKATKRISHGLTINSSFTWSKNEDIGTEAEVAYSAAMPVENDVNNRQIDKYLSAYDQPFLFVFAGTYTTPRLQGNGLLGNKAVSWIARDWQISAVLRYGSGLPIKAPLAQNGLTSLLFLGSGPGNSGGTLMDRVPGVPLYTVNINCHCYNPSTSFVLNPAAWTDPPPGQYGTAAAYYNDYRYQRRPVENMSLARQFRIREGFSLQIRAEFTNIFNRTEANNPTSTNALATQTTVNGQTTAGFGYINTGTVFAQPRQGQLVARVQF